MAIRQAEISRFDRILFFASSSNSGGNRRELFPGRHDSVISIRATNAHGRFSDNNPPVDPHGPAVYGTLGSNVMPLAWPRNMKDNPMATSGMSGVSVATAVAAGIAAMMLSFATLGLVETKAEAEQELGRERIFHHPLHIKKLWTRKGILALFSRMSEDTMGNRCMYLSPIKFFSSERGALKCWTSMQDACV